MPLEPADLAAAVEAVVFVSSEPVTMKMLAEIFPEETEASLGTALEQLAASFEQPGRGLLLDRVAGGYRIATRPDVHAHVARFVQRERAERLSIRTLETLSVIAYKQPVTAAEVGEIRGVDASGTVKTLLDRGLVRVAGRKKVVGRPFVYGTTKAFLTTFGLNDLGELPTLKELEEFVTDVPTTLPSEVEVADEGEPIASGGDEAVAADGNGRAHEPDDADAVAADGSDEPPPEPAKPARRRRGRQPEAATGEES
jgi:segregation and condensation protein B